MNKYQISLFVLLLLLSRSVLNHVSAEERNFEKAKKCCKNDESLIGSVCTDGTPMDLKCESRYLLDPSLDKDEGFQIDANGNLLSSITTYQDTYTVDNADFCITKLPNKSWGAIVCFSKEFQLDQSKWYGLRAICGFVSVGFLIATLVVYALVPDLRDLQGKCIMHAVSSLAVALFNLGIMQLADLSEDMCLFYSFFSYFTFVTTFFWLNVIAFHVFKTVFCPNMIGTEKQWYYIYIAYGHGAPLIFLVSLLIAHHVPGDHLKPGLAVNKCWFKGQTETWAYFYGPISVLLIVNLCLFICCVTRLWRDSQRVNDLKMKSLKYKVRLYIKLFVLMGIMWIFEVISSALDNKHQVLDYFWMLTDYINVLQGVLIFLLLVVCRKRALRGLANRDLCGLRFPSAWKSFQDEETVPVDEEAERTVQQQI